MTFMWRLHQGPPPTWFNLDPTLHTCFLSQLSIYLSRFLLHPTNCKSTPSSSSDTQTSLHIWQSPITLLELYKNSYSKLSIQCYCLYRLSCSEPMFTLFKTSLAIIYVFSEVQLRDHFFEDSSMINQPTPRIGLGNLQAFKLAPCAHLEKTLSILYCYMSLM